MNITLDQSITDIKQVDLTAFSKSFLQKIPNLYEKLKFIKAPNISSYSFLSRFGQIPALQAQNSCLREIRKKPIEFEAQDKNFLDQKRMNLVQMRLVEPMGFVSIDRLNAYRHYSIKEGGNANSQTYINGYICKQFFVKAEKLSGLLVCNQGLL